MTAPVPPTGARRPSAILLVTVDTLRGDTVSFGGYSLPTTPFLDRMAKEGVVFANAYAPSSWTPPSMASIFTGLEPTSHGVTTGVVARGRATSQVVLADSLRTIAETLHERGRTTIGVASNLHLGRDLGFGQGFDYFFDPPAFIPAATVNLRARETLAAALGAEWRTAWRRGSLFLWLHYFDPHEPLLPYDPWLDRHSPKRPDRLPDSPARLLLREMKRRFPNPGPELAAALRPLYDGEVARVDEHLRQLWEELGADEDVLLVLTADHGEELVDRGGLGHSHSLYEELVHVPLLIRWPRGLAGGRRIDTPVSVSDLLATISALDGAELSERDRERNLPRLLTAPSPQASRPVFLELHPPKPARWAMRNGNWKLIVYVHQPRAELYDLALDPGERHDLAVERPEVVVRLRAELERWRAGLPPPPPVTVYRDPDAELIRQLRELGYLDN